MDYRKLTAACTLAGYERNFMNLMRGDRIAQQNMAEGLMAETAAFAMPKSLDDKYENAITEKSILRQFSTVFSQYSGSSHILAAMSDDLAECVPENGAIDIQDASNDFTQIPIGRYKLAALLRLPGSFVADAAFDLEGYLVRRLASAFAKAEDRYFISGSGVDEPVGLLHATEGAENGASANQLSYDAVIDLYYSVKPEYRRNGVWLMNDETAQTLKKLKDDAGNYLWRGSDDTVMGKPVMITEYMPDAEAGARPILFGDLSYYWIVKRSPVTVRMLRELFVLNGQIGYMAFELIDGRLVRREAVKALNIASE